MNEINMDYKQLLKEAIQKQKITIVCIC